MTCRTGFQPVLNLLRYRPRSLSESRHSDRVRQAGSPSYCSGAFPFYWPPPERHAADMSGLVAIVGRPNVGKSALFNRMVWQRIAIVHDEPGVTRDRVMAEAEWRGRGFTVVDTGGLGLLRGEKADDAIIRAAFDQAQIAIETADVIVFVVNVQEGVMPLDREVAERLRRSGKPVLVAVNKVDHDRAEAGVAEFAELGFGQLFPVTAIHGHGLEPLLSAAMKLL